MWNRGREQDDRRTATGHRTRVFPERRQRRTYYKARHKLKEQEFTNSLSPLQSDPASPSSQQGKRRPNRKNSRPSGVVLMGSSLITIPLGFFWVGGTRSSGWFVGLKIHLNLDAYFWWSTLMFVVWAVWVFGLERISYRANRANLPTGLSSVPVRSVITPKVGRWTNIAITSSSTGYSASVPKTCRFRCLA
jgi:hypothetical protein